MKLSELKIGDKISHYCHGELVEGVIVNRDGKGVVSRHKPVRWGKDISFETWINPSTHLQSKISPTTPASFYKGEQITI